MDFRVVVYLVVISMLSACASNSNKTLTQATLDLSSSGLVTIRSAGIATNMIAEVVSVKNLDTSEQIYSYDIANRDGIENASLRLESGSYRVTSVCNDRQFVDRFQKLIEIQLKQERYWWAKFYGKKGVEGVLPAYSFEVNVVGGELITPVSLKATGNKSCSVIYGHKKLNGVPKTSMSEQEFRAKYSDKMRLYN